MKKDKLTQSLEILKRTAEDMLINILDNKQKEEYLREFEKIRYEIFESIDIKNKYSSNEDINFTNKNYKAEEKEGVLKIVIPEVLPKYKNVSNYAYKNILLNVSQITKKYKDLFKDKLTFVMIIVHEKQANMDIDNKYVKPIIDALVNSKVIKDDNFTNMFYSAMGKNDTTKPYTEVYVLDAKYLLGWINTVQKIFEKCPM